MALIAANTDYTDKDFEALRARLFQTLASVFPEWSDTSVANFGNLLLELFAFIGDTLTFYQDNQAAEAYLGSVTQRKNLLALVKLIGYTPSSSSAASTDVIFSIPEPTAGDVLIEAGRTVSTPEVVEAVRFQVLENTVIPAGQTTVSVPVENSQNATDQFISNGRPNQFFILEQAPYIDDSLLVIAADGVYTPVLSFLSSRATDKHYQVSIDQNDRARITFGNGSNGAIPVGSIVATYKIGGGAAGNVDENTLTELEGSFSDSFGNVVFMSATNPQKASNGLNRPTLALIKALAPEALRVQERTIAREDFVIGARQVAGVARALLLTSNESGSVPENEGFLYIIPRGGGLPSTLLKDQVKYAVTVTNPTAPTFKLHVQDPLYKVIDIEVVIRKRAGFTGPALKSAIVTALAEWFVIENEDQTPNTNVDFGANLLDENEDPEGKIAWSDIFNVIRDVPGIRKLDASTVGLLVNGVRADLQLADAEFPVLGTVTVIDGDTQEVIP